LIEGISIIDEIRKGRYEASVVATYNAYFPFYEQVVLPQLRNCGSRQNMLLMDARMCGALLIEESTRPRFAGREYCLLPIRAGGAFHPKLVLLIGKDKGLLLVGSHNLTLAGFSHNRELTNRSELNEPDDETSRRPFQDAWAFLTAWTAQLPQPLPKFLADLESLAPWLTGPMAPDIESRFLGVLPGSGPLWERVKPRIPRKIERIIVTGPFFDGDLAFLKMLQQEYTPREFIVGIDPKTVTITEHASAMLPKARFVTADCLRDGKGYLHAKAMLFEAHDGSKTLIVGSANPSRSAWLSSVSKDGNAETVIIEQRPAKSTGAKRLGFEALIKQPLVSEEGWHDIKDHQEAVLESDAAGGSPVLAFVTEDGIDIDVSSLKRELKKEVRIVDSSNTLILRLNAESQSKQHIHLKIPDASLRRRASLIELTTKTGHSFSAIVHHPEELLELAQTDRQRVLRDALNSLTTETPMIEELMKVVEKVIFDGDVRFSGISRKQKASSNQSVAEETVQTEFVVDLKDIKKNKKHGLRIASGDLGILLDALIHRLGAGLEASIISAPPIGRSEEDLIGTDENDDESKNQINGDILLASCQRKVKTLFSRMVRQLENAVGSQEHSLRVIAQSAAVLGLAHRLCQVTPSDAIWMPKGETLVPREVRWNFFLNATRILYSRNNAVMKAAIKALDGKPCLEISMLRGLLIWLAWDCDFRVNDVLEFEDAEEVVDNLYGLARLLVMAPDVMGDQEAYERAADALEGLWPLYFLDDYDSSWLDEFRNWCKEIARTMKSLPSKAVVSRAPDVGDIVYPTKSAVPSLYVVVEASQGRVRLVDLDGDDELKTFATGYVTVVKAA
jgi:hypothetical protein